MSDYLLDTDVLIRCLRGFESAVSVARDLTEEGDLHISVLSHLELLTLARPEDEKLTTDFLGPFVLHPVSESIAHQAAGLLKNAKSPANTLNLSEAVIAATALQHGLTLVTYNSAHLRRVDQLKLHPLVSADDSDR
ncbi:MAG: PIN domain-containing protein [Rudaea sp.]